MSAGPVGRTPDSDSDWYNIDLGDIDHRLVSNPANIAQLQAENASLTARVSGLVAQISRLNIETRNTQEQNIALMEARNDLVAQISRLNIEIRNTQEQNMEARDEHKGQIQGLREEREGLIRTTTDLTAENNMLRERVRARDVAISYLIELTIRPPTVSEMIKSAPQLARIVLDLAK